MSDAETQVVAQWLVTSDADADVFFATEDTIAAQESGAFWLDGHDIGSGAFNVFLYASNIDETVAVLVGLEAAGRLPPGMRIGVAEYTNAERTDWTYRAAHPATLEQFVLI